MLQANHVGGSQQRKSEVCFNEIYNFIFVLFRYFTSVKVSKNSESPQTLSQVQKYWRLNLLVMQISHSRIMHLLLLCHGGDEGGSNSTTQKTGNANKDL